MERNTFKQPSIVSKCLVACNFLDQVHIKFFFRLDTLFYRIKLAEVTQVPEGNDDMEMEETIQPETGEETLQQ